MTVAIQASDRDPKGYRLTTELLVAEPREQVFAFFSDAFQLETMTPPWLRFSVQRPFPTEMRSGTLIDYKLRLHGIPIRWRSRISNWDPPFQFVDEQVRGPYLYWTHLHTFQEFDGGTLVGDIVYYRVLFGSIMQSLLVRRDLTRIFEFRRETLSRIFTPVPGQSSERVNV